MADADSDGHELTFSEQKNPAKDASKGKRKGKHAVEEKEKFKKRGMSKPGHAVIISGGSTQPALNDVPVDLSENHRDLVMEYSDMFEPSKGADFIDIQDGDAISESSDTEVVAHTKEQIHYGNEAASSESNSDSDVNDGPPPLNSDEDDDGSDADGIDGPPPLDSDDNAENTDDEEELPMSPNSGSIDELDHNKVHAENKRRGVKSSEDSESDSDSESGVKEVPPPLDSEEEKEEHEVSSHNAEHVESANVDTVESDAHDSPVEEVDNNEENKDNVDDDDERHGHDNNDDDDEQHGDVSDNDDDGHDDNSDDDIERHDDNNEYVDDDAKEKEEEAEEETTEAVPHSPEPVDPVIENPEESEQSDSPPEPEKQIPLQDQSDDSDDDIVDDKESDHEASIEEVPVASVANEVSSAAHPEEDSDSHDDKQEQDEETDITEDTNVNFELSEKEDTVQISAGHVHNHGQPVSLRKEQSLDDDSDQDSGDSPEFVPIDDENELEWDVEDFDLPPQKSVSKSKKVNTEGLEVDKLKKSFLDTLKSEAEQTKVVETQQKAEPKKKEKVDKGLQNVNTKTTLKDEKKRTNDNSKNASNQDLKSETGKYPKKVTKVTPPKPEQVKAEKKSVKDEVKGTSKNVASSKPVDTTSKPAKTKVKATDRSVDKTDVKQKTEKQRKEIKESPRTTEAPSVERKTVAKSAKAKSASASSLHSGVSEQQKGVVEQQRAQTLPTKEKKKARPASGNIQSDSRSQIKHKEEVSLPASQAKKEVKKPRKSDSDATAESLLRQKPQKASSSESVSRQKKQSPAVTTSHREKEKPAENTEVRKTKSKKTANRPVSVGNDHQDGINHERKKHIDTHAPLKNSAEVKASKSRTRPTSNGHLSSSQEKLSSHSSRHDHGAREHHGGHKHSGHTHDRSKHVWLCRDDEIHKLIAQKASLLKEYESGSLAGRKVFSGHKSRHKREEDPADLPDVGFISNKQTRRQARPLSEAIPDRAPYSSRRKAQRRSLQLSYSGSSTDEDERTNKAAETKRGGGTFAVGLAARNIEHTEAGGGGSDSEHEETCEYCAAEKAASKARERNPAWEGPHHPRNLLLGVVYTAKYLGSSQIMSPQSPNKAVRMEQAQEAVGRIKVPEGEDQPTTDVDLFISTERLKVVNSGTKEVMLDHALRTVSFIADIGDVLVLMARQPPEESTHQEVLKPSQILASVGTAQTDHKAIKITCHVFQAPEAQVIAKSIGQAFNVAYQEFLRQNGLTDEVIEDAEYNGVLEAQKILGEDLSLLADENSSKEVIVNKKPAEMLGVMIVESGWGSMIPCAIIAHLAKDGPAAKSGRLNVGDQILSVNGTSLVGLPLLECQNIIKGIRPTTKVVMKIVSCPPTVQVSVNRPDTKYQLGFSVQNGMICSLMRGSIAERGGVRVGHRIIEINGESVVATSHQHIVELLATTVGEIRMKTMPASMYRLLVGLETPTHI